MVRDSKYQGPEMTPEIRFYTRIPRPQLEAIVASYNKVHNTKLTLNAYARMVFERFVGFPDIQQIKADAKRERNGENLGELIRSRRHNY